MHRLTVIRRDAQLVEACFDFGSLRLEDPLLSQIAIPIPLQRAVRKRKLDFLAGRLCALAALAELLDLNNDEKNATYIGIGEKRQPLWPQGVVGSITHSQGRARAIVGRQETYRALGCDIEHLIDSDLEGISKQICQAKEWQELVDHSRLSKKALLTLVFSAKETLFKTLYPLVHEYFGFHKAWAKLAADGSLSLKLCAPLGDFKFGETFAIDYQLIQDSYYSTQLHLRAT